MSRRHLSQIVNPNWKQVCLVDTLSTVEAITSAFVKVLNHSVENVSGTFASKADLQRTVMSQEALLSQFKCEMQSSQHKHELQAQLEAAKYDVIMCLIGSIISAYAFVFAVTGIPSSGIACETPKNSSVILLLTRVHHEYLCFLILFSKTDDDICLDFRFMPCSCLVMGRLTCSLGFSQIGPTDKTN
ncbi:hypothetical protein L1987_76543 [Smallanthus sonchifolius]|uniref:Uncharacterized protein n=1 Tax=Smallanthus sonchifolius TaxID=185202 RepID=A0ACB8Z8B4_9ASTR|nr:hypothetical protein L1987_76543 [Smallanthus sonchifolius]